MFDFKNAANYDKIMETLNSMNRGNERGNPEEEKTFWRPTIDKAGNSYSVVRLLPTPQVDGPDGVPYVHLQRYGFKTALGKWYIENSPLTIGREDPVAEFNSKLWNSGQQEYARKQKLRHNYIANVYVVEDQQNPGAVGGVFRHSFGKKIIEKIMMAMKPTYPDEKPINPFSLLEDGANLKLKLRTVDEYLNYDLCSFDTPGRLMNFTDDQLREIWKKAYSLKELVDVSRFKSYSDLKEAFIKATGEQEYMRIMGSGSGPIDVSATANQRPEQKTIVTAEEKMKRETPVVDKSPVAEAADDDDDELKFFRELAGE